MKTYICTKMINAVPVKTVNGVPWPAGLPLPAVTEKGEPVDCCCSVGCEPVFEDGYMFTTSEDDKYPQYMSAADFEKMCRCTEAMTFGDALAALKCGKRVARKGWNGKNQYVELAYAISYKNRAGETVNPDHQAIGNMVLAFCGTSGIQLGWLASQADMLAEDWYVVE